MGLLTEILIFSIIICYEPFKCLLGLSGLFSYAFNSLYAYELRVCTAFLQYCPSMPFFSGLSGVEALWLLLKSGLRADEVASFLFTSPALT